MAKSSTPGGPQRGAARARREPPKRNGPDRRAKGGREGDGDRDSSPPVDKPFPEVSEVVAEAVRLGYRVVEENLRQGRMAADRLMARDYDVDDAGDDIVTLGKRFLGLARDLGTSWFDLIGAVLDDPRLRDAVRPTPRDEVRRGRARQAARQTDGEPAAHSVPVQVIGHPDAFGEALLADLRGLRQPPQVAPLRSIDGPRNAPTIMGARLGADSETGALALIVPVPPDQPSGTYAGTIHETGSKRLLGSVSLTVP